MVPHPQGGPNSAEQNHSGRANAGAGGPPRGHPYPPMMFYPGQMGPAPYPHSHMMQYPAKPEGNDSQMENS